MATESDPLTPGQPQPRLRALARGVTCNRLVMVGMLILIGGLSVFFDWQLQNLRSEVVVDEDKIHKMNDVIVAQAEVIDRFQDSITNSDVLKRVSALEENLADTEKRMTEKLDETQANINAQLQKTLKDLDETVTAAEGVIHSEVEMVKRDVDQYVIETQDQFSMENSFMVYQLAGTFTLLCLLISMWHMTAHLRNFNQPFVQRKILAILWMCPIYGITSWLSLVWVSCEGYLEIIKDFYEAYLIYQFLSFLIAVIGGGDRNVAVDVLAKYADHLKPPYRMCGCLRKPKVYESDRALADAVLLQCQLFAMQFVLLRPLTSIAMFTCNQLGYYGGGDSSADYRSPQFYIIVVQNISIFTAFTGLLKFYHAVQDELSWCRPFPKFLCIKGVVFMTFWQGLVITILANTTEAGVRGGSNARDDADPDIWAKQAQNFLICLEMLGFSIAHFYCFPTEEWEEGYRPADRPDAKFGDTVALGDFLSDLKLIVKGGRKSMKKKKSVRILSTASEGEGDEEEGKEKKQIGDKGDEESGEDAGNDEGDEEEDASDDTHDLSISDIEEIEQSGATSELRQAAARVLSSRLLQTDSYDEEEPSSPEHNNENGESEEKPSEDTHEQVSAPTEDTSAFGGYMGESSLGGDDSSEQPGETTSLLGGNQSADELLRPSIFTTMGKMDKKYT